MYPRYSISGEKNEDLVLGVDESELGEELYNICICNFLLLMCISLIWICMFSDVDWYFSELDLHFSDRELCFSDIDWYVYDRVC